MKALKTRLPLTEAQKRWLATQQAVEEARAPIRKCADMKVRCATCRHFREHPHSPRYNYCARRTSKHTPNGLATTKRNNVCAQWEGKA